MSYFFLRDRDSKTSFWIASSSSVVLCYRVTCEKDRKLSAVVQKSFARRSFLLMQCFFITIAQFNSR